MKFDIFAFFFMYFIISSKKKRRTSRKKLTTILYKWFVYKSSALYDDGEVSKSCSLKGFDLRHFCGEGIWKR